MEEDCKHENVRPSAEDQTLGVECESCNELLAYCWRDNHIPESLWNRACETKDEMGIGAIPSEQSRDDVCALCKEIINEFELGKDNG